MDKKIKELVDKCKTDKDFNMSEFIKGFNEILEGYYFSQGYKDGYSDGYQEK